MYVCKCALLWYAFNSEHTTRCLLSSMFTGYCDLGSFVGGVVTYAVLTYVCVVHVCIHSRIQGVGSFFFFVVFLLPSCVRVEWVRVT